MSKRFQTKLAGDGQRQYDELFRRYEDNPILSSHDWPYPVNTVFNPAATLYDGKVLLLARVEDRRGMSHLTKAESADGCRNWKRRIQSISPRINGASRIRASPICRSLRSTL